MRTKQLIPGLKNSQKIRVVIGGVDLNTTVQDAYLRLFNRSSHNLAVIMSLESLARYNTAHAPHHKLNPVNAVGHVGTWNGHEVQLTLIKD